MLSQFLEYWERGYLVVYGVRRAYRIRLVPAREAGRLLAYRQVKRHPIPRDAGDFRLVDRQICRGTFGYKNARSLPPGQYCQSQINEHGIEYKCSTTAGKSNFSGKVFQRSVAMMHHSVIPAVGSSRRITRWGLVLQAPFTNPADPESRLAGGASQHSYLGTFRNRPEFSVSWYCWGVPT